jgi:hypothetical protein
VSALYVDGSALYVAGNGFLEKRDITTGSLTWSKASLGSGTSTLIMSLVVDQNHDVYESERSTYSISKFDSSGNVIWTKSTPSFASQYVTLAGGSYKLLVHGATNNAPASSTDSFIYAAGGSGIYNHGLYAGSDSNWTYEKRDVSTGALISSGANGAYFELLNLGYQPFDFNGMYPDATSTQYQSVSDASLGASNLQWKISKTCSMWDYVPAMFLDIGLRLQEPGKASSSVIAIQPPNYRTPFPGTLDEPVSPLRISKNGTTYAIAYQPYYSQYNSSATTLRYIPPGFSGPVSSAPVFRLINPSEKVGITADLKINGSDTPGPVNVSGGGSVNVSWTSTGATSCNVSPNGWQGLSGSQTDTSFANVPDSRTYVLTCTAPGHQTTGFDFITSGGSWNTGYYSAPLTAIDYITVTSSNTSVTSAAPVLNFSVNGTTTAPVYATPGDTIVLNWSSLNAQSCGISAPGIPNYQVNDLAGSASIITFSTYTFACKGFGAFGTTTKTMWMGALPTPPAIAINANPTSVSSGGASTITWIVQAHNSSNVKSCTVTKNGATFATFNPPSPVFQWDGTGGTSSGSLTSATTFLFSCTVTNGRDLTVSTSTVVTVN